MDKNSLTLMAEADIKNISLSVDASLEPITLDHLEQMKIFGQSFVAHLISADIVESYGQLLNSSRIQTVTAKIELNIEFLLSPVLSVAQDSSFMESISPKCKVSRLKSSNTNS